jgi:sarcosine oxidase subunit alpha
MAQRISKGVTRGPPIQIEVDGRVIGGFAGESLATVLLANNITAFRHDREGRPRAPYCNMGVCFECLLRDVTQPTSGWLRACLTPAQDGQRLTTLGRDGADER